MSTGTPDIRVTFRPEGIEGVIAELRTLRQEANKAAREPTAGVNALTDAFGKFKSLLLTLGITATAAGLVALAKNALHSADAIGKLGQRTGTTSEEFSVLNNVATGNGVATEDLATSLDGLNKRLEALRKGTSDQVDAFGELGLSAKNFEGLNTAQAFELIAKRAAALGTDISKIDLEAILGRGARKLIPTLQALGDKGFARAREEAEKLGVVISVDLAAQSRKAGDAMDEAAKRTQGLATAFVAGLAPALIEMQGGLKSATTGEGLETIKKWGQVIGHTVNGVIEAFRLVAHVVGGVFDFLGDGFASTGAAIAAAVRGDFSGAMAIMEARGEKAREQLAGIWEGIKKDASKVGDALTVKAPEAIVKGRVGFERDDAEAKGLKERADVRQQFADLNKRLAEDELKTLSDVNKRRKELADSSIELERKLAEARQAGVTDQVSAQKKISDAEAAALQARLQNANGAARAELDISQTKTQALIRYIDDHVQNGTRKQALLTEVSRQSTAQQLQIAQTYYASLNQLADGYLTKYKTSKAAIAAIDEEVSGRRRRTEELLNDAKLAALPELAQQQVRIQMAEQKTVELRKAAAAGDIERVKRLGGEIEKLAASILGGAGDKAETITIAERLLGDSNKVLDEFQAKQKAAFVQQAADAERNLAAVVEKIRSIQQAMNELAAQQVNLKIGVPDEQLQAMVNQIAAFLARSPFQIAVQPVVQASSVSGGEASAPGFGAGGRLGGSSPHPRADNLLFAGTAGEFVQPVRSVQHYGLDFMDSLRTLRFPRYADGGLIGGGLDAAAPAQQQHEHFLNVGGRRIGPVFADRDLMENMVSALQRELG